MQDKQASQKQHHDKKSRDQHFQVGQSVLVENNKPEPKWVVGTVVEKLGDMFRLETKSGKDMLINCYKQQLPKPTLTLIMISRMT